MTEVEPQPVVGGQWVRGRDEEELHVGSLVRAVLGRDPATVPTADLLAFAAGNGIPLAALGDRDDDPQWGEALAYSGAGVSRPQLREMLMGLRADHLLAASLAGNVDGLRSELQDWMVFDSFAIWQLLQQGRLTPKEQEQAYGQLRLMAIQYEKYPVVKWKDNAELQSIFKAALEENPEHAASIRAKNWKRPMWLP